VGATRHAPVVRRGRAPAGAPRRQQHRLRHRRSAARQRPARRPAARGDCPRRTHHGGRAVRGARTTARANGILSRGPVLRDRRRRHQRTRPPPSRPELDLGGHPAALRRRGPRQRHPRDSRRRTPWLVDPRARSLVHRAPRRQDAQVPPPGLRRPRAQRLRRHRDRGAPVVDRLSQRAAPVHPGQVARQEPGSGRPRRARSDGEGRRRGRRREPGEHLEPPATQTDPAALLPRRARDRARQPRALRPPAGRGRPAPRHAPRERARHRRGAGFARLLGRLGRARQRDGGSRHGRRPRSRAGAPGRGVLRDPARVALARAGARLLLRFLERGALALVPPGPRAPHLSGR